MAAIFDLTVTPTSESVHISPAVLMDLGNVAVVFGMSFLSFINAEIEVLPV